MADAVMMVIGIDPGASGALVAMSADGTLLWVRDMPVHTVARDGKQRTVVDARALAAHLVGDLYRGPLTVAVEDVGYIPGDGGLGAFAFGRAVGIVHGVVGALGLPMRTVRPQVWRKALGHRGGKGEARQMARDRWPQHINAFARVKDDGRAEAALIAEWCRRDMRPIEAS